MKSPKNKLHRWLRTNMQEIKYGSKADIAKLYVKDVTKRNKINNGSTY